MRRLALSLLLALAVAVPAAAQTPTPTPPSPPADEPAPERRYLKTTALEFGEAYIDGNFVRPDGSYSLVRGKTKFRNLIELRGNFRPELARTASKLP